MKTKRAPQWDDWRCYRCGKWQAGATERTTHITPAGIAVALCPPCAKEQA